jgi:predicted TIM-barrel fold metal-dependent hydrolase
LHPADFAFEIIVIDTHQHLLYPAEFPYSWTKDFPTLQGNFRIEEYRAAAEDCGIEATIFMEVDVDENHSFDEAHFFCELAGEPGSGILGVIAAGRPGMDGFAARIESLLHPKLKGIRRVLHTQPDELSQSRVFRQNIALLGRLGLTFDLCVLQRQLGVALDLARACPGTTFILDHCGVPDIAGNNAPHGPGFVAWQAAITELARAQNVTGKISGLIAYARPDQRHAGALRPYVDTMIEVLGPGRLVWGGDWPVCNLGNGLKPWVEITRELLAPLSETERAQILTGTAKKTYRIP